MLSPGKFVPHNRTMRWHHIVIIALCWQAASLDAATPDVQPGVYRVAEGPDVAGGLDIAADGSFRYFLAAGVLDEQGQGRWERQGPKICLFSDPKPVPPQISRDTASREDDKSSQGETDDADEKPFLIVTWPDGNPIALIDFRLALEGGEIVEGYTQRNGWSRDPADTSKPLWVELSLEIYGVKPARFELDGPHDGPWRFILAPNDFGVVDFEGTCLRREGEGYVLERKEGEMRFVL